MAKKNKKNQNINSSPKYLWINYFKKPIKWLAHLINDYGNTKLSIYPTGTAFVYALSDERKKHPELTYQQVVEKVRKLYNQTRKNIGLPTETTPSLSAAGLAITGGTVSPWFAIPDIVFDVAASIDEPSTSNNIHTIADFPETVAKFTPSKIDDYVAKGVLTLGNIDDAVSTSGRNMFSNFDKKPGKINNTTDKTSVRESTNIKYRKNGGYIRKMLTASGGPITRYETLPNIEVVGYRPIELKTYKPLHKEYPFTGHSSLDIPIDENTAYTQGWHSPYVISVDKTSNSKDYNLITNNCADATLGALNYIFGTKEKPLLFTTPGDVRDYAINKLHGKVTRDKDGIDTILIPRNKNNAKKISKRALEWRKNKDDKTIYEFEYKDGGRIRKMLTASGGPIKLYDTLWADNWRDRLTSPVVVAKQLAELTSKIPIKYLGGNKDNARKEFWKQEPVFQHAIDSIANQYGISPESLKYRLDREGFTDYNIKRRNTKIKKGHQQFEPRGYKLLNNSLYKLAGTQIGLDDAKTYIDSGRVKLINEKWFDLGTFKNEKGRITYPVEPATLNDGIGIVAAHLKYFRDKALLDFPNASEYDLDRYANAYYNRGALGGKKWVLAGAKGYNYRKQGGKMNILEFLKNGSGIHIKEKNKGKFTSYCGGKVTDECILKGKNSSNPAIRKRATFAANARKWKHKDGGFFLSLKVNKHLAFVPGATITDSNPKAYSQIKKHKGDTEWIDKSSKGLKVKSNLNPKYYLKRKVEKAAKGTTFKLTISNALGKVGNFLNSDTGKLAINGITSMIGTAALNRAIDKLIEANNKMEKADIQKAKLDRYRKLLGLQDMTPEIDSSGNIINKSSIVALNNAYKQAMGSTDTSEILDTYDRVNRLLGNEKYMNLLDMLGDMVDTLSSILGGKKKDSSTNNNSYFGNHVNTLYKNYGTFNSDGSMNLGGELGTFSTTGGYKPRQYQMKTYTPLLKFSL